MYIFYQLGGREAVIVGCVEAARATGPTEERKTEERIGVRCRQRTMHTRSVEGNPRRGPTHVVVAAAMFTSSLRIFSPYLSLLALVLFLLCYFSGSVASVVPRARPRFTRMLLSHSSRKQLLLKGTGASSRASLAIANRTYALLRSVQSHGNGFQRGFRKAAYYSTSARLDNQTGGVGLGGKPEWGPGLPLYRQSCCFSAGCGLC